MRVAVIVVAAGIGVRLGAGTPKAFALLCGEPLLAHALRGVLGCAEVARVIVVAPASHLGEALSVAGEDPRIEIVAGGADRAASVKAGLGALHPDDGIVLVHDAARCLAPAELFARVIEAVRAGHPAVVPGLAVSDTVKVVDAEGRVQATPHRESLRAIQTPQGFLREVLERAHAEGGIATDEVGLASSEGGIATDDVGFASSEGGIATDDVGLASSEGGIATDDVGFASSEGGIATDDAGLVERIGGHVLVVDGDPRALKITSTLDLAVATALMQDGTHDN